MTKGTLSPRPRAKPEPAPAPAAGAAPAGKSANLQDLFLNHLRRDKTQVTMFLVKGVMLQGSIAAYDLFCMLLEREGFVQLAYKHAVSTIQPASPVDLTTGLDDEDGLQD